MTIVKNMLNKKHGFKKNIMKRTVEITEEELKNLKLIRNYFGEHDKTQLEQLAYIELDRLVKKLQQSVVMCSICKTPINLKENAVYDLKNEACHKICFKEHHI